MPFSASVTSFLCDYDRDHVYSEAAFPLGEACQSILFLHRAPGHLPLYTQAIDGHDEALRTYQLIFLIHTKSIYLQV